MIRRPPRSTLDRSSAASDVYKRQNELSMSSDFDVSNITKPEETFLSVRIKMLQTQVPVSYTHLRAHETVLDLVCRLLLEKKKRKNSHDQTTFMIYYRRSQPPDLSVYTTPQL